VDCMPNLQISFRFIISVRVMVFNCFSIQIGQKLKYSTTHQLIELYDNILLALDKKQITSIT
jgi:hypothetical protein